MANEGFGVTGGAVGGGTAPKGKRFIAAAVDLVAIPILLGVLAGVILLAVPEAIRNVVLVLINIAWLIVRDAVISPGRKMVGLKLVSLSGEKVTVGQAFIRNILLIIPFVLVIGYIVELIFILTKDNRIADQWAKTRVVNA